MSDKREHKLPVYTPEEFEQLAISHAKERFAMTPPELRGYFYYKNDEEALSTFRKSFYALMAGRCEIVPSDQSTKHVKHVLSPMR